MKFKIYSIIFTLSILQSLTADTIIVNNMIESDLYAGEYYVKGTSVELAGNITFIPSGNSIEIERVPRKILYDRYLVFSEQETDLLPKLSLEVFHEMISVAIGTLQGTEFYVVEDESKLIKTYNNLEYILKPFTNITEVIKEGFQTGQASLDALFKAIRDRVLKKSPRIKAEVRTGTDISQGEKAVINTRLGRVKKSLESYLGKKLTNNQTVRIGLCMSGGGYRAMIASLGFLKGIKNVGLLDCTLYMAGLSGSTWLIAPWLESKKDLEPYKEMLLPKLTTDLVHGKIDNNQIVNLLTQKMIFDLPLSLVDIYGALLAQKLLDSFASDPQEIYLAPQVNYIKDGTYPYPIYTAVIPLRTYEWFEFTPHECGSPYLQAFVPTVAFGRLFKNGKSVIDTEPEFSLGFMMGICGSAFSGNMRQYLESFEDKIKPKALRDLLYFAISKPRVGTTRITSASIYNPTFQMKNYPLNKNKKITLVDAGIAFNIPMPPLLRKERALDIIIILDASFEVKDAPALRKAEIYAHKYNLPFPSINYTDIDKQVISIHSDNENPAIPVVIYIPLIKNERYDAKFNPADFLETGHLNTFNFIYTPVQVDQLSGLIEFTIQESNQLIKNVIEKIIETKKKP